MVLITAQAIQAAPARRAMMPAIRKLFAMGSEIAEPPVTAPPSDVCEPAAEWVQAHDDNHPDKVDAWQFKAPAWRERDGVLVERWRFEHPVDHAVARVARADGQQV